ncbi:MAG: flagellar filament capping protein FliD [Lachnospiraceae bacterium]
MANTITASIYNYYMTTYAPKSDGRLDSHKKSELKDIYSNILKMNKEAPLYILKHSEETKAFAISLKEDARQLQHTILQSAGDKQDDLFKKNIAFSSNENILSAEYIGEGGSSEDIPVHSVEVKSLATPQINVGNFLNAYDLDIEPGEYSFDISTNGMGYEFQYSISDKDSNYDIQAKLSRLVNQANIGLNATLVEGVNNTYALRISSTRTGSRPGADGTFKPIFSISDHKSSLQKGSVEYFGMDYIMSVASNAHFSVDGEENTSPSNHFTIGKNYLINLFGTSPEGGESVTVGVKANTESLKYNIRTLVGGYNSFLQAMGEYYASRSATGKLIHEISGISNLYHNELDAIGITKSEDGSLSIDDDLLSQAAESDEAADLLSPLRDFSTSLYNKTENISRDPLNYADKTIVTYKNPGKNFPNPYMTSNYSGLLFNYYC